MGSIIEREGKDGERLFYLSFFDADGKQLTRAAKHKDGSRARNRREADRLLVDAEAAVHAGVKMAKIKASEDEKKRATITIRELAERFGAEARPASKKNYRPTQRVVDEYRIACRSLLKRHVLDRIGDRAAASLDLLAVEKVRDQVLDDGFALDTAGKMLTTLSRLYDWSRRERLIDCPNPCKGVTRPKADTGSPEYLTAQQGGALIAWLAVNGEPMLHAMVVLGLTSAMRKGEMFGLTWSCLHLDVGRIDVEASYDGQTKTAHARSLRLHPTAIPVLKRWQALCPATPDRLVFPVSAGRGRWRMGNTNDMLDLNRAMQKAINQMHDRPWHLLRHSAASNLVMSGASLYAVQKILGHSDPKQTMRYAKLSPDHLAQEVERLSFPAPPADATVTSIDAARNDRELGRNLCSDVTDSAEATKIVNE